MEGGKENKGERIYVHTSECKWKRKDNREILSHNIKMCILA